MKTESEYWLKEADQIIAEDPEKYRDYHAMQLRHAYERGAAESAVCFRNLLEAAKEYLSTGDCSGSSPCSGCDYHQLKAAIADCESMAEPANADFSHSRELK
jgi:hypothetical protein